MTALIRGLAADNAWQPLLATSAQATVESSFAHAINLMAGEELLTLVSSAGRPAPGALITDAPDFPRIPAGSVVRIAPDRMQMGPLTVDLAGIAFFSCAVTPVAPTAAISSARLKAVLNEVGAPGSFIGSERQSVFDRAIQRRLLRGSQRLQDALGTALRTEGDADTIREALTPAVERLVGLGVGLTPSGDDYLVGTFAALHHLPDSGILRRTLGDRVIAAAGQTTVVSGHFLKAAAAGQFHSDIAQATVVALTRPDALESAFRQVVAIGSTSGTDALFGLVDTLSTFLEPSGFVPEGAFQ